MNLSLKISMRHVATHLPFGIHYGWVVVSLLVVVQVLGASIGMAAGVIVAPLSDTEGGFGWSISLISTALMVYYFVGAAFSPISGWLGDRYGPRLMMISGGLLYASSMILMGIMTHAWHFFLTFGVMLSITQSISMVPLIAAVSLWFRKRLGLAIGLLWGAGGIGTAVMSPLIATLIEAVGWRGTFWTIGLTGGSLLIILTLIFRNRPADLGLSPYGLSAQDPKEISLPKNIERLRLKTYNKHIRRTRAFWNLPVIHSLGCAGHGIILIYSIPLAMQQGISLVSAAWILSLISLFSVISRFVSPILTEEFGGKAIMVLAMFIQGITVLSLFWASDVWMFYMFGIFFGMGFGGEMSTYLVVNRQYFGHGPIATTYGFQMMGALIGHGIAVGISGLVLYVVDSYNALLILSMAFSFAGSAIVLLLEPSKQLLIPNWENSLPPEARTQHLTTEAH